MKKKIRRKKRIPGVPPGTLSVENLIGIEGNFTIIKYDRQNYIKSLLYSTKDYKRDEIPDSVTWVRINEIHNSTIVKDIGSCFNLHPLILEDILNPGQRAKINDFDDYLFIVLNLPRFNKESNVIDDDQISIVLGAGFVITFQTGTEDSLAPIMDRIEKNKGRIRQMKADYLAYTLIDFIVDHHFPVIEDVEESLEQLEDQLTSTASPDIVKKIYHIKQVISKLRKSIFPVREILRKLEHRDNPLVSEGVLIYLHDVYEHTVQIIENLESFHDKLASAHDVYLSTASNRMNEIMKVLTIFSSTFIPLSFLAGLYGMNFKFMPELEFPWAYPVLLCIMLFVSIMLLIYFKRKKWIGWKKRQPRDSSRKPPVK